MIRKRYRLNLRKESNFFLEANVFKTRLFKVFSKSNKLNQFRFAIIIPKKVVVKAVQRNKLKRLISSMILNWITSHQDSCNQSSMSGDLVFVMIDYSNQEVKKLDEEINFILNQLLC